MTVHKLRAIKGGRLSGRRSPATEKAFKEAAREMAKQPGGFRAWAIVMVDSEGSARTTYCHDDALFELLGSMADVHHRILRENED